jgi:hypothetical protein
VTVNGKAQRVKEKKGYAVIRRTWKKGDQVKIEFPMEIRTIKANDKVEADRDKIALQRGPIVYALEWPEVDNKEVLCLVVDKDQSFSEEYRADFLDGVVVLKGKARAARNNEEGKVEFDEEQHITLIPYHTWNNRGPGEMMVWLPINDKSVRPLPAPTIASSSEVSGSTPSRMLISVNDQLLPEKSIDRTWPFYHWWPKNKSLEWIQYDFDSTQTVSSASVYWYDDGPFGGCRIPASWEIRYKSNGRWIPVKVKTEYAVSKDEWNKIEFETITTDAMRLMVQLPEKTSAGIHEWIVE